MMELTPASCDAKTGPVSAECGGFLAGIEPGINPIGDAGFLAGAIGRWVTRALPDAGGTCAR